MYAKFAALAALVAGASAQKVCSLTAESHPAMSWSKCTSSGCTNVAGSITVDANWRWTHQLSSATNCYSGNKWDTAVCTDGKTCAENCCIEGADYPGTYGITTTGNALNLKFVHKGPYSTNIGSRTYLMESETKYQSKCLQSISPKWRDSY